MSILARCTSGIPSEQFSNRMAFHHTKAARSLSINPETVIQQNAPGSSLATASNSKDRASTAMPTRISEPAVGALKQLV